MTACLGHSIETIDSIIEHLDHEYEHQPIRMMGLRATKELMNSIYTAMVSLALAIVQKLIPKDN